MVLSLLLALLALRLGLRIRRARAARTPLRAARAAHLRVARPAVVLLVVGLVGGPLSAVWLRGWEPLRTFHGVVGLVAGALFVAAAVYGRRLERGEGGARAAHARVAALASLAAAVAAVAGFVLLP